MKLLLGIAIGVVVTGIGAWMVCDMRAAAREVRYMGEIESPLIKCLEDIVETYDNGDPKLAEAKVRLLKSSWEDYWIDREPNRTIYQEVLAVQVQEPVTEQ